MPVQDPLEAGTPAEKQGGKRDLVGLVGSSSFKMVFVLLAKPVAIQVWIAIVEIGEPNFEEPLARSNVCLKLAMFLILNKRF